MQPRQYSLCEVWSGDAENVSLLQYNVVLKVTPKPHDAENGLKTRRNVRKLSLNDTASYFTIFNDDTY